MALGKYLISLASGLLIKNRNNLKPLFPFLKTDAESLQQSLPLSSTLICSVPQTHFSSSSVASQHVLEVFKRSRSSNYSVLIIIVLNWALVTFLRWETRISFHLGSWWELAKGENCMRFGRQNEVAAVLLWKGSLFHSLRLSWKDAGKPREWVLACPSSPPCSAPSHFLAMLVRMLNGRPERPQMFETEATVFPLPSLLSARGYTPLLGFPWQLQSVHSGHCLGEPVITSVSDIPAVPFQTLFPSSSPLNKV